MKELIFQSENLLFSFFLNFLKIKDNLLFKRSSTKEYEDQLIESKEWFKLNRMCLACLRVLGRRKYIFNSRWSSGVNLINLRKNSFEFNFIKIFQVMGEKYFYCSNLFPHSQNRWLFFSWTQIFSSFEKKRFKSKGK